MQQWESKLTNLAKQINPGIFNVIIYTDASTSSWGTVREDKTAYDFWNGLKKEHINYLKLLARALRELAAGLEDRKIQYYHHIQY